MKKFIAFILLTVLLLSFVACSSASYEDKLLGKWYVKIGNNSSVLYSFEKEGETYKGGRMCVNNGSLSDFATYDSFSATSSSITFYKGNETITEAYHFKDGYLYIDDIKFEKIE